MDAGISDEATFANILAPGFELRFHEHD